jgi:hypothetical protein
MDHKDLNNADGKEALNLSSDPKSTTLSWINSITFLSILMAGGLLLLFLPKNEISETERRKLCQFPTFSMKNLVEGDYTDSIELYYADNFPFRESFVQMAAGLKDLYGYRADDVMIYNLDAKKSVIVQNEEEIIKEDSVVYDSVTVAQLDSMSVLDTLQNDGEYVESVFIYGGKAFQIFGGTKNTAKPFSNMVNQYQKVLGPEVKIFCMEIPTPIDFYLPSKYKNKQNYEKPNIDLVYAALDSGIVPVHAYEEIQKHTNEYLYFNTDHHWTGRAGYYAYRGFCAAAGFQPYELSSLDRKVKKKFLGTLYALTHDKRLKENIDSVEYFKLPVATTVSYFTDEKSKKGIASKLYAESASGGNSYSVFLGGDCPLIKVNTTNKNGRRAMIIKDSYGNAFAPYLALHYEQVFIVDYRHFKSNIADFIKQNKVTDFIFAHNTFVVNTRYTSVREMALLKSYRGLAVPKAVVPDTTLPLKEIKQDTIK